MGKKNYHDYQTGPVGGRMTKYRHYPATQCPANDRMFGSTLDEKHRCQGVRGHSGWHWYYRPDGWLVQWPYEKDIKKGTDISHSETPPDHKDYIHPKDKWKDCHSANGKTVCLGPGDTA